MSQDETAKTTENSILSDDFRGSPNNTADQNAITLRDTPNFEHINSEIIFSNQNDVVKGNFIIDITRKIEYLSNNFCDSYECKSLKPAINSPNYYAMTLDPHMPVRKQFLDAFAGENIKGLSSAIEFENVYVTSLKQRRVTAIIPKPAGIPLREYIKNNGVFKESELINILPNFIKIIGLIERQNLVHGRVNPDNIYVSEDKNLSLSEGISGPCGFFQSPLYEPLERMFLSPYAKSDQGIAIDGFALGVTIIFMLTGEEISLNQDPQTICEQRLIHGSFNVIAGEKIQSNIIKLLLKGLLCDRKNERWRSNKILECLEGRKYTAATSVPYNEASRSYIFNEKKYDNTGILAYDLWQNWIVSKKIISDEGLLRWLERSVGDVQMAENIDYIRKFSRFNRADANSVDDDTLAKILIVLDPFMPTRYLSVAFDINMFGQILAFAVRNNNNEILNIINKFLRFGTYKQIEKINAELKLEKQMIFSTLDRCANLITNPAMGFGVERCLYLLNPLLPCQSIYVIKHFPLNLSHLLEIIDKELAPTSQPFLDRHIAAFIANSLDIEFEVKPKVANIHPEFGNDKTLSSILLFSLAQKSTKQKLNNIAARYLESLNPVINLYYSNTNRKNIRSELIKIAKQGDLLAMVQMLTDPQSIAKDKIGMLEASKNFTILENNINKLGNKKAYFEIGYQYGLHICVILAYLICAGYILVLTIK